MLFERVESEGLAHYSYLVGDQGAAFVIDPRRDVDVYLEKAARAGYRIAMILETHRNEDYVVGSLELAARTGADIWHADAHLEYGYGRPVKDDQTWEVGRLKFKAIHSPGHTLGSMSYLLSDPAGAPWVVFTGDALFAGDVGRVDFMGPDRLEAMAGLLYDTLHQRILPLGDPVIVCPAHGAGSVCGAGIAERVWTTIGLERQHNPRLQVGDRAGFIAQVARQLEQPPYFREMERLNLEGAPLLGAEPVPTPLSAQDFARAAQDAIVLDTRMELAFSAAHVPDALSIWMSGLPSFAGWFLPYDRPILLVNEVDDPLPTMRLLLRLGYDNVVGFLSGGMLAWHKAGQESRAIRTITVPQLCHLLDHDSASVLDIRSEEELLQAGRIPEALHIHLTQLPRHMNLVPQDHPLYVFCGSGLRSMIAASLLRSRGWENVVVVLGGLAGWNSATCPLQ